MSHDVFISHSSLDKLAADAICHGLEAKGIRCWIAPRDQIAGKAYGEQITAAIEAADVMVLVFSDNVNRSQAVLNEINIAAGADVTIVPFRIASVEFNSELHFYLGRMHWLDAFPQPLDTYMDTLATTVRRNLRHAPPPPPETAAATAAAATIDPPPRSPPPPPLPPPPEGVAFAPAPPPNADNRLLIIGAGVFGLVLLIAFVAARMQGPPPAPPSAPPDAFGTNTATQDAGTSSADAFNAAFDKSAYASCLPGAEGRGATVAAAESYCSCMVSQIDKLTAQQKLALNPNSPEVQQAAAACASPQ